MGVRIVVTGGAGFLGTLLVRRLLHEPVALGGAAPADLAGLTVVDLAAPPDDVRADPRVRTVAGALEGALAGLRAARESIRSNPQLTAEQKREALEGIENGERDVRESLTRDD